MVRHYQILTNLDCNLRCKYCYEHEKHKGKNDIESIKTFISLSIEEFIGNKDYKCMNDASFEFVGGETFLHVDLIEECLHHIETTIKTKKLKGFPRLSFSTNATLFNKNKNLQELIKKYSKYLDIGISIDGTKETHDLNRVTIDGKGSYDDAVAGYNFLKLYIPPNRLSVKATYNHNTINKYAEGILNLINLGFTNIVANTVYEETWTREDGILIYDQLCIVADYLIDNSLVGKVFINELNSSPEFIKNNGIASKKLDNYCGSCKFMRALGFDNKIYGCHRFSTTDIKSIGNLLDNEIKIKNTKLINEVSTHYLKYPDSCKQCMFQNLCGTCAVLPYELNISPEEWFNQKRQCGFTLAKGWAKCYLINKLTNNV